MSDMLHSTTRRLRQEAVYAWGMHAFPDDMDPETRGLRFLEEAMELYQANGGDPMKAVHLLTYVFLRPRGEVAQEIGGVMVTLYALAASLNLSVADAEAIEIDRVLTGSLADFRRRQQEKRDAGL